MNDEFTTERLEAVLISIGHHLEIPQRPAELTAARPAGLRKRTSQLLLAAAAVAVLLGSVLLVPSTRAAIADLFGIGSTRIEITGDAPLDQTELPHISQGLTRVSVDEATAIVGDDLPDTSGTPLGPPEAIYRMPEGGVLLAWRGDTATLWIRAATDTEIIFRKLLSTGESIETVNGLGTEALIITDPHLLQTPQRRLSARNVLLWHDNEREYRFEADMTGAELIDIARSLQ